MNKKSYIQEILKSNQLFIERTGKDFFTAYQNGQDPQITFVTCADSRVHSEALQESSFNKFFTIRNIGNQIYSNEGSVDYGILHLKTPVLLILGHTDCGAIKAYTAGYEQESDSIKNELNHLIPAIPKSSNSLLENIKMNIHYQVKICVEKYNNLMISNELLIIGAIYDFRNELNEGFGKVKVISINGQIED